MEYYLDDIEVCEIVGMFEDEYVYDIEMEDESHTFIANDMLVHNSTYISFDHALKSCDWKGTPTEFVLAMNEHKMQDYLDDCFADYAKKFNTKNLQKLELEKISHSALMVAKKKYILELAWKEPGVFYAPLEKIKPTGIEIVQGQTPKFVRKILKDVINLIFEKNTSLTYMDVVTKLRDYKKQFMLQSPDDISKTVSVGDYEKFILKDKDTVEVGPHCPIHIKAAAIYNHELMKSKWKTKYELIKTGDKCKYFYTTNKGNVYAFLPKNFPVEIGYPIDYDVQFEKTVISPVNKYISALNFNPIPSNLIVPKALF